jgi:3-methyladenine DNA glycosylase AlkC
MVMPQNDFVAAYGLGYLDLSLRALYELTKRFTAEGAIRAFLQAYPEQTLTWLAEWATDPNCHVRRLVSEGARPRLPLAPRLPEFVKNPQPVLALLEQLKANPVLMVPRSFANNLNDIAKDHPDLVVETLARWKQAADPGTQWIIGHATRTLLKQGHADALALLGYGAATSISVVSFQLTPRIDERRIGGERTYRPVILGTRNKRRSPFGRLVAKAQALLVIVDEAFLDRAEAGDGADVHPPADECDPGNLPKPAGFG